MGSNKNRDHIQRVYADGRINLPVDLMEKRNLKPGDYVMIEDDGDSLRVTPGKFVARKASLPEVERVESA